MSEVFDFGEFEEGEGEWKVPEYLANMYAMWTQLGQAAETLAYSHYAAHAASEGIPAANLPPDTIIEAFMIGPIDDQERAKRDDDEPLVAHDLLLTAEAAIKLLVDALHAKLKDMDALPPWWKEDYDPNTDRPIMGWEVEMLRRLLDEDDDEA